MKSYMLKTQYESTGNQVEANTRISSKRATSKHHIIGKLESSSIQNQKFNFDTNCEPSDSKWDLKCRPKWNSNTRNTEANEEFEGPIDLVADPLQNMQNMQKFNFSNLSDFSSLNERKLEEYSNSILMKSQISKNANDYTFYFKNKSSATSDLEWIYNLRKSSPTNLNFNLNLNLNPFKNFNQFKNSKINNNQKKLNLKLKKVGGNFNFITNKFKSLKCNPPSFYDIQRNFNFNNTINDKLSLKKLNTLKNVKDIDVEGNPAKIFHLIRHLRGPVTTLQMINFELNLRNYKNNNVVTNPKARISTFRPETAGISKLYLNPINKVNNKKYLYKFRYCSIRT